MPALAVALFLGACTRDVDTAHDGGGLPKLPINLPLPKQVPLPQLPVLALPPGLLPVLPDGKVLLIEAAQARIELDPSVSDPITAVGACTDSITYCVSPGERTLADCVFSVPACTTSTPWNEPLACCPSACKSAFELLRRQGVEPLAAFERTFFLEPDCFPGVRDALEGR